MATTQQPTAFTRRTTVFSTIVLLALAAFTVGAVLDDSRYTLALMALSIPILMFTLSQRERWGR